MTYWSMPEHARPYARSHGAPVRTDWVFSTLNPAGHNAQSQPHGCGVGALIYGHRETARTGDPWRSPDKMTDSQYFAAVEDVLAMAGCLDLAL